MEDNQKSTVITTPHLTFASSPESQISSDSTSHQSSPQLHVLTVDSSPENPFERSQNTYKGTLYSPEGGSLTRSLSSLSDHTNLTHLSSLVEGEGDHLDLDSERSQKDAPEGIKAPEKLMEVESVGVVRGYVHQEPMVVKKFDLGGGIGKVEARSGDGGGVGIGGGGNVKRDARSSGVSGADGGWNGKVEARSGGGDDARNGKMEATSGDGVGGNEKVEGRSGGDRNGKMGARNGDGGGGFGGNGKVEARSSGGGNGKGGRSGLSISRRGKSGKMMKMVAFGFRVCGAICCLISFSVMAADKNKGWALDSFHRYKEFRYSLSVNVIGFVYLAGQAFDSGFYLATGKSALQHPYRYYFDFAVDQIVTYLLISASSSASTRIDDWQLNWGKDKFPDMATTSVAISFLAFAAIAFSSLISGYTLCTSKLLQF